MPKVVIAEKDLTNAEAIQYDDHIVLIPSEKAISGLEAGKEEYFTKASTFKKALDDANVAWDTTTKTVYRLLQLGMTVLYRVVNNYSELEDYDAFWAKYADKGEYNLRFLTCGAYASQKAAECVIKCAAERGDAIALIDIPTLLTPITLNLSNVFVDGEVSVEDNSFDPSNLKLYATFSSGSYSEIVDKTSSDAFTFTPSTPVTEVGTHSVIVKGTYVDTSGVTWESNPISLQYVIEESEEEGE